MTTDKITDFSKEIFEKYCTGNSRIVEVTLKDDSVLEGIFVSFIHGDETAGDPFIIKWHFVETSDIPRYKSFISLDGSEEIGRFIKQEDIAKVNFKCEKNKT